MDDLVRGVTPEVLESGSTLGPWLFFDGPTVNGTPAMVGTDDVWIAQMCEGPGYDQQRGEAVANGRLMAAAPDLFAALREVQQYLDVAREEVGSPLDALADKVDDALALAKYGR